MLSSAQHCKIAVWLYRVRYLLEFTCKTMAMFYSSAVKFKYILRQLKYLSKLKEISKANKIMNRIETDHSERHDVTLSYPTSISTLLIPSFSLHTLHTP